MTRAGASSRKFALLIFVVVGMVSLAAFSAGCSTKTAEQPKPEPRIGEREYDPAVWGTYYPEVYEQWQKTADPRPVNKSAYKRGFDGGVMFDKLSEYPFMPLLFKGWGFGIDYKEPRGHAYMLIDQSEADPSRVAAGGACLTCKSPYAQDLQAEDKKKFFNASYTDAVKMIPEEHRTLGVSCIDCHDNETMALQTRRWTVDAALADIGVKKSEMKKSDERLMVCAQCHVTYSVMKDAGKSVDVSFPWKGGQWGAITVEDIIANLESDKARLEWTQQVTGFKLAFIRHPDFEFFSAGSTHFAAGVACNDCHMAPVGLDGAADHDIISPLKRDMVACQQCHTDSPEERRAKVIAIQEASLTDFVDAGYRVASVAKLFEIANRSLETTTGDPQYDAAAAEYRQAFYRVTYMGAENSVGFHNPPEGHRILVDAKTHAAKADEQLRALLKSKGVSAPAQVDLELATYLTDRGVHSLDFVREDYIADPSGAAEKTWSESLDPLLK